MAKKRGSTGRSRTLPKDPWATAKAGLLSEDAQTFMQHATHLLFQRQPALTELVRAHEHRLFELALGELTAPPVRIEAIKGLVALTSDVRKLAPLLDRDLTTTMLDAVGAAIAGDAGLVKSKRAVTALLATLAAPGDWTPHYNAVRALRYFDDPRVVPALVGARKHEQSAVQREAIYGLGRHRVEAAVPDLVATLTSKDGQHVTAAACALDQIGTKAALAALANKATYAHALKLAASSIEGRFAVRALRWFRIASVEHDLIALATKTEDGEIIERACDALIALQAQGALAALANHVVVNDDPYFGCYLVDTMIGIAGATKPKPDAIAKLAKALGSAPIELLDNLAAESDQKRFEIDRCTPDQQARIASWRRALTAKVTPAAHKAPISKLLSSPASLEA